LGNWRSVLVWRGQRSATTRISDFCSPRSASPGSAATTKAPSQLWGSSSCFAISASHSVKSARFTQRDLVWPAPRGETSRPPRSTNSTIASPARSRLEAPCVTPWLIIRPLSTIAHDSAMRSRACSRGCPCGHPIPTSLSCPESTRHLERSTGRADRIEHSTLRSDDLATSSQPGREPLSPNGVRGVSPAEDSGGGVNDQVCATLPKARYRAARGHERSTALHGRPNDEALGAARSR